MVNFYRLNFENLSRKFVVLLPCRLGLGIHLTEHRCTTTTHEQIRNHVKSIWSLLDIVMKVSSLYAAIEDWVLINYSQETLLEQLSDEDCILPPAPDANWNELNPFTRMIVQQAMTNSCSARFNLFALHQRRGSRNTRIQSKLQRHFFSLCFPATSDLQRHAKTFNKKCHHFLHCFRLIVSHE